MNNYLRPSTLLNYNHPTIQHLLYERKWKDLSVYDKIKSIYTFVKDDILFGYNHKDDMKASEILKEGLGQCNTKSILLMALLRAVDIPCRTHGFYIDKSMQKGALYGLTYLLAPNKITHAYVEVYYNDQWLALEGVIPDKDYFDRVKSLIYHNRDYFSGYAIAMHNLDDDLYFTGDDTYSQHLSITQDLGIYAIPDYFFDRYNNKPSQLKNWFYKHVFTKKINNRLNKLRRL